MRVILGANLYRRQNKWVNKLAENHCRQKRSEMCVKSFKNEGDKDGLF